MLRQIIEVEVCVREVIYVLTRILRPTEKEPRRLLHLMRHASKIIQNLDE